MAETRDAAPTPTDAHRAPVEATTARAQATAAVADPARIAAVRATGLLDTEVDETFDRLTRLAVRLVSVPAAFISLVDAARDVYKSACGFGEPLASTRELTGPTFCHYAVQRTTPLVIPDTAADPAYRDVLTRQPLGVAAYVGVPLVVGGQAVGAFCAIDTQPRAWTAGEVEVLVELAASAQREIELRDGVRAAEERTAAVAAAERTTARILTVVGDGILGLAPDGTTTFANPAAARLLGYAEADLVGRPQHVLIHHHRLDGAAYAVEDCPIYRALRTGVPCRVDTEVFWRQDGTPLPVEYTATPALEDGRIVGAVLSFQDVTARRAAATERAQLVDALAAERERLRSVIRHAPAPMALHVGPEHRFALVNAAYQRVSGGGRDVTGLTPREAFPELAGTGIHEMFDRVYATGLAWSGPETLVRYDRDGTGVQDTWINLRLEPVWDPGGRVEGVLNFSFDVTEQVRARRQVEGLLAESERAQAEAEAARAEAEIVRRRAEDANAAKSQFLANMSHELRTPLNAIGGYTQLLELGLHGPVTEAQRTALGRVQRAQHRLLVLINDVLNYAKLEGGRVEYALDVVDVRAVIAEVAPLLEPQLAAKGLALDVRLPDGPCEVWADREKLGQVLVNLLSNATKFTEARHPATGTPGRVTVNVATRPDAGRDVVFLRVADTGRGIPHDKQGAIFEPFVQVQTGYARGTEGTGLGLAISRDLARGMGGDLRARSAEGEGAVFTVTLRRAAERSDTGP